MDVAAAVPSCLVRMSLVGSWSTGLEMNGGPLWQSGLPWGVVPRPSRPSCLARDGLIRKIRKHLRDVDGDDSSVGIISQCSPCLSSEKKCSFTFCSSSLLMSDDMVLACFWSTAESGQQWKCSRPDLWYSDLDPPTHVVPESHPVSLNPDQSTSLDPSETPLKLPLKNLIT